MSRPVWRSPWWPVSVAVVPVVLALWAASPPGRFFGMGLAAVAGWAVVGLLWFVTGWLAVAEVPRRWVSLWPVLIVPALFAATGAVARTGVVERLAFDLHRPALERLAAEVTAGGRVADRTVGLFETRADRDRDSGCVHITVRDAGFMNQAGFAYCPDRVPVNSPQPGRGYSYQPIDGPWYEFGYAW